MATEPKTLTPRHQQAPADGRDPNVKIPSRVKLEAERADALIKAQQAPAEEAPAEGADVIELAPMTAQPHQQMPAATPPAQQPPATPATPPAQQGDKTYSENDFNAMKARWERSDKAAQKLSEEVNNLRNVIATMNVAPAPAAPAENAPPAELQAKSFLTDQEIADYGPEFLDVVGKKAREIAAAETAELKKQLETLSRGMQATSQVTMQQARETMLAHLDEKIPDWRTLNVDPNFIAWLRLPDPFSGAIRQNLLTEAYGQNNSARVAAFFQGFLAEEAAVAPANAPPAQQPSAAQPARVPLETFAAPGRAKSAAATAPAEKPIITRAQVAAFYADVAAGKYRGREQEKEANELAIFAATNEGRLR